MLHLLARVAHVGHFFELFAGLAILCDASQLLTAQNGLQFAFQLGSDAFLEDPVVSFQVDVCEDVLQLLLAEDPVPLLLEDGVLLAGFVRVDGRDDRVDAIKDVALYRNAAIRHDLLHLLPSHVEVLVQVIHHLSYYRAS